MSQQKRRFLAAASLAAALTLGMPLPSRAVGLWEAGVPATLAVRAQAWLERLGFGARPATPARRPSARWEKQGSAIDPNGAATRVTTRTTYSDAPSDQGSAIDPNGLP